MKVKLLNIVTIITGHVFRSKIEYVPTGNINLLNMDSISTTGKVILDELDTKRVFIKDTKPEEIIMPGDILFKAKGLNNTAVFIEKIPHNTTVTASCHIIRVIDKTVLPEYICLWLNSTIAKKHFSKGAGQATGVTIANVSKTTLESLEVVIPPIKQQKLLVEIENCTKEQQELQLQIADKKSILNRAIIDKELRKY